MKIEFNTTPGINMKQINDSMELDSGTTIATLTITRDDNSSFKIYLEVRGEVRVRYKGSIYTCASQMPEPLLKLFHAGCLRDVEVIDNNWFEVFLEDSEGVIGSDFVDAENLDPFELLSLMVTTAMDITARNTPDNEYTPTQPEEKAPFEGFHPAPEKTQ